MFERPSWLKNLQDEALTQAQRVGLPSRRDENWRYTAFDQWMKAKPLEATTRKNGLGSTENFDLDTYVQNLVKAAHSVLFFVDGEYQAAQSQLSSHELLSVSSLHTGFSTFSNLDWFRRMVVRAPNANLKGLGWSAQAQIDEGSVIHVSASHKENQVTRSHKVAVVHLHKKISMDINDPVVTKNIYSVEGEGQAEIIEVHILSSTAAGEIYNFSDVRLAPGARLKLGQYVMGLPGAAACLINDTQAEVEKNANLNLLTVTSSGHLSRHEHAVALREEGAHVDLNSLALGSGSSHIVNSTLVVHEKGFTTSDQTAKSILHDSAQFVFSGRLVIELDAQKSDAKQYNHNLLLSDAAEANSRPQLEVLADDVKAAHGATFGSVNEDEIFYLQSRALSREAATQMLLDGHTQAFLDKIESEFIRTAIVRGPV